MATATQITFILYSLLLASITFAGVDRDHTYEDFRRGMAILVWLHGIFTIAFLLWWVPANLVEMIALCTVIGSLWAPWLLCLPYLNREKWKPKTATVKDAVLNAAVTALRIGLVVGFWII